MRLVGYCRMPHHFPLLLWPHGDGDLSRWMQWLMTSLVACGVALIRPSATFSPNALENMDRVHRGEVQHGVRVLLPELDSYFVAGDTG